jgi:hypothetical protein
MNDLQKAYGLIRLWAVVSTGPGKEHTNAKVWGQLTYPEAEARAKMQFAADPDSYTSIVFVTNNADEL